MNNQNKTIVKNGKELKCGYTTGSCATAAAVAAAKMLLLQQVTTDITIKLPGGEAVTFTIEDATYTKDMASCSVIKDAGDDPDVTDGIKIVATCSCTQSGINVTGGKGIGIATTKGLSFDVGEYAINPVPKKMIIENVTLLCETLCYENGIDIMLSVPNGEEIAKKTFNARLGIKGGISILGTTGIVEPMSEKALVDTIKLLVDKSRLNDSENILISPGNYGREYCKCHLKIDIDKGIKCSNFIGEALDYITYKGFKKALLVGHVGKLVKLSGGVMNTHSNMADCRMELIAIHAVLAGASRQTAEEIMQCLTTDQAIEILEQEKLTESTFKRIVDRIKFHIDYRTKGEVQVEVIIFSQDKVLIQSDNADSFIGLFGG